MFDIFFFFFFVVVLFRRGVGCIYRRQNGRDRIFVAWCCVFLSTQQRRSLQKNDKEFVKLVRSKANRSVDDDGNDDPDGKKFMSRALTSTVISSFSSDDDRKREDNKRSQPFEWKDEFDCLCCRDVSRLMWFLTTLVLCIEISLHTDWCDPWMWSSRLRVVVLVDLEFRDCKWFWFNTDFVFSNVCLEQVVWREIELQ